MKKKSIFATRLYSILMKLKFENMRTLKFCRTMLLLFITVLSVCSFAQQSDAFVLVDVSGSMQNQNINQEAKDIVLELIQGKFSQSNWNAKGWCEVKAAGDFFNSPVQQMIHDKGVCCIMPFGNMRTVYKYKLTTFKEGDMKSFEDFYKSAFPSLHNENQTYLTLAKAYSVVIAAQKGLQGKKIWLVVYSDGMGDTMKTGAFPSDLQEAWDQFGATEASIMKKNGTLRKYDGRYHYDIEVWTMGPIPVDNKRFSIVLPQNGVSEETAIEIKRDVNLDISWKNNDGAVKMIVHSMSSNEQLISGDDSYSSSVSELSGTIAFHKEGKYKIILQDSGQNSECRFVRVVPPPDNSLGKLKFTTPSNGTSEQTAVEIKKGDKLNLSWANNIGSVTMTIQSVLSGKPMKIDNHKDYYTKTVSTHSGNIVFHKSGVYKITLKDSKMNSDSRYVKVTSPPPFMTILLVLLAVVVAIILVKKFIIDPKPTPEPPHTETDNWG